MKKLSVGKIVAAVAVGLGLVGAGIFGGLALAEPKTITETQIVEVEKIVEKEVPVEVIKTVEVEKIVQVEDLAFLKLACDKLMYDDIMECKEEVSAENEALEFALALLDDENKLFDFLEDEGVIADENDAKVIRVYDDIEDIEVVESDFDGEEYEFKVALKVEDEDQDVKKKLLVTVHIEDGEGEFTDVEEI
jgi:hypothetical protein